jgi:hypothetical protein
VAFYRAVIRSRVHPAWVVLGALAFAMLGGTGLRSAFGVYLKPMEAEFGWSRVALSGAAAVSLVASIYSSDRSQAAHR